MEQMKTSSVAEIGGCDHRLLIAGREKEREGETLTLFFPSWSGVEQARGNVTYLKERRKGTACCNAISLASVPLSGQGIQRIFLTLSAQFALFKIPSCRTEHRSICLLSEVAAVQWFS